MEKQLKEGKLNINERQTWNNNIKKSNS
jgi:hypothetical protein